MRLRLPRLIRKWARTGSIAIILLSILTGCDLVTGSAPEPDSISITPGSLSFDVLDESRMLQAVVRDQRGQVLEDRTVSWSSSHQATATVNAMGVVTAVANGTATITATAGSAIQSIPVTVTQTASEVHQLSGNAQIGAMSAQLPEPLTIRVEDRLGNPVEGMLVTFEVTSGGGSVSPSSVTTSETGLASTLWTLGDSPGEQRVEVRVGTLEPIIFTAVGLGGDYQIELQFLSDVTPAFRQAFQAAAARWESIITGNLQAIQMNLTAEVLGESCELENAPDLMRVIDDLLIFVVIEPLDGPLGTLAGAGPCYIRSSNTLPVVGVIKVDSEDLEFIQDFGLLETVATHEIAHVLGFGTLWDHPEFELLADPVPATTPDDSDDLPDTHFVGPQAIQAFDAAGGVDYTDGNKVPVEAEGGEGTRNSHWRQEVFGSELMTGEVAFGGSPLSRVTIASLLDMGYQVNLGAADSFTLVAPHGIAAAPEGEPIGFGDDILTNPIYLVSDDGEVLGVLQP